MILYVKILQTNNLMPCNLTTTKKLMKYLFSQIEIEPKICYKYRIKDYTK